MWIADIIVDLAWFSATKGNLGAPKARALQQTFEPDLKVSLLLYGDETAIRHLRIVFPTEVRAIADACKNRNIRSWAHSLEIASALSMLTFSSTAMPFPAPSGPLVVFQRGNEESCSLSIVPQYEAPRSPDFPTAAGLMAGWAVDFEGHLQLLSRFLNPSSPIEVRWLNGYRLLEWHFLRGGTRLSANSRFRAFLAEHGSLLDAHRKPGQTRHGVLESVRANVAHALLARGHTPGAAATEDPVNLTFGAMQVLVNHILNEGRTDNLRFSLTQLH